MLGHIFFSFFIVLVSRSDRNLANQEQFRSVSYFAIIKHETVNPNVAIIKVWSKNVSIRVNRSRWIRTSFTNHYSFDIFANVLQPCWYHLILSSNEYGFDSRVINTSIWIRGLNGLDKYYGGVIFETEKIGHLPTCAKFCQDPNSKKA